MSTTVSPSKTRVMGWYVLRWTAITDWYRATRKREAAANKAKSKRQQSQPADSQASESRQEETKKLEEVVHESQSLLAHARSFEIFPTILTIDRHKLTICRKQFFWVQEIVSVPIENIKNIQAHMGPFFGSLVITSDHFANNTQHVKWLWRKDVQKIQKLIQGAAVAMNELDIKEVEPKKLKKLLSRLGEGHSDQF